MKKTIETACIHGGQSPDPTTGAILPPVTQSTTYVMQGVGQHKGFTYSRADNPTVATLEAALGEVENALPAVCFATGMAAIHTLFFGLLRSGDHVVCSDVVYGGTVRLLNEFFTVFGVSATFVDSADLKSVESSIQSNTKLVLIETPANPTMKLTDIAGVASITKAAGIPLAVDNTFLTNVLQDCFALGADIVVYSTTKYIEGHNSTVGGALLVRDQQLRDRFAFTRKSVGSIQAPWDAWLTIRGLKTLSLRMREHSKNALRIAKWLEQQEAVRFVHFPGLPSFPQHDLAKQQQKDWGGMLAFELRGGLEAGRSLMSSVKLCSLAESLGAVETLITHPATMTHPDVPLAQREATGITDGLIRLSVGLENPDDIIADLDQAMTIVEATLAAT